MPNLIGKRIRLSYYDQNIDFEKILPRVGTVISRHSTENVNNWYLLKLNNPFVYKNHQHEQLLIRSKWTSSEIKEAEQTAVFILLIPNMKLLKEPNIEIDRFEHVAWGWANVLKASSRAV